MRLWILSDWHLGHDRWWAPFLDVQAPSADVVVVAGDVSEGCRASTMTMGGWSGGKRKQTVFVPGNHEFYGQVMQDDLAAAREAAQRRKERAHLLSRDTAVIDGVRFIGATLWTDYRLYGQPRAAMIEAGHTMNDHRLIRYRESNGHISRFMPWHAAVEHRLDLAFIVEQLEQPFAGETVVVTHHLPSPRSIATRFRSSWLNPAFASDLDWLIERYQPALWVHGHTHDVCDYQIGRTRVICNPRGYWRRYSSEFDERLVVEI
jgi:Icc-related predicted phosphoesterase